MISILPYPPFSPVSKLSIFLSLLVCRQSPYWRGRLGSSQIIRRRESLALYKSFNTLWYCIRKNLQNVFEVSSPPYYLYMAYLCPFFLYFNLFFYCRAIFSITMLTVFSLLFSFQIFFHTFKVSVNNAWFNCSECIVGFTPHILFRSLGVTVGSRAQSINNFKLSALKNV